MSIRREVVSLSQLLRRNENSRSSRGSGRAPPLPLQTSRRKAEATLSAGLTTVETRKAQSTSFPESLSKSGHQPVTFTQRVLDASRELTPQPEFRAGIQRNKDYQALSQEVYEAESEQLSAMTSMSQSSFSQPQSQNLLGPSHDDQLYRLQQWQTQQTLPTHKSPTRCNGIEKLQEIESNLIKAFIGQTRDQKHQQTELLTQFASPIKKSIVEVKAKLESTFESQQQQLETIGGLEKSISSMAESVTVLHQQGLDNKGACEKTRMSVLNDTAAVKAALSDLQAKVKIVEGGVKSCSGLVAQVIGAKSTSHNAILAALTNSSCICRKDTNLAKGSDTAPRKRRRSPYRQILAGSCSDSPTSGLSDHKRAQLYEDSDRNWYGTDFDEVDNKSLVTVLQRIKRLRAKRRQNRHD